MTKSSCLRYDNEVYPVEAGTSEYVVRDLTYGKPVPVQCIKSRTLHLAWLANAGNARRIKDTKTPAQE